MYRVLVVDDDYTLQQSLSESLKFHNFFVEVASSGLSALKKIHSDTFDLVVMDVNMPEMSGLEALIEIKKYNPSIIVLILTAYSNVKDAVKAVKEGAYNYLEKPISSDNLVSLIKRAIKARHMVETTAFSAPQLSLGKNDQHNQFVGESKAMLNVFYLIEKLARVATPVLIRGESGTGKELVARAIHYNGPRKDEKFVTLNCAAIPEHLIESELFGHEKGAFTGAVERKIGKFQYADGGTLFLDEIGDISPNMQVKMLRVLQEKTFTPIGSNREITSDVRIIAASNRNFENMIEERTFREDLFYRLNVLPVYLPPLRERQSDIPHLTEYYIHYFNNIYSLNIKGTSPEAQKLLNIHDWPGNIRELRNVIERAFIIESGDTINISSLPENFLPTHEKIIHSADKENVKDIINVEDIQSSVLEEGHNSSHENNYNFLFEYKADQLSENTRLDFQEAKNAFEKEFINQALKINSGKINQTAINANIPKKTLLRKIEKYSINPKEYYS